MRLRAAAAVLVVLIVSGCRGSDVTAPFNPDFTCTFAHASRSVDSFLKLPEPIQRVLHARAGEIADRGEFFNSTDVKEKPAPFDRFIRGGEIGEKWYVWYEHGGIAYWKQILIIGSDPSGTPRVIVQVHATGQDGLCAQTDRLLDGVTR